jgi:hypothetical protein
MADITVQDMAITGTTLNFGAAAAGDTIPMTAADRVCLLVNNASGSSINVTLTVKATPQIVSGIGSETIADKVIAVAAGAIKSIGSIGVGFIDQTTGKVSVAYSSTTTVTRTAIRVPAPV